MSPRLAPVEPPYPPEVADELARWMPPGAPLDPLLLFRTLVADLPLAQAMLPLGRFLLGRRCAVDRRLRELVIDRVCARMGCEYEWGVHVTAFAAAAGLGDAVVRATVHGRADDPAFGPDDALVVALVDELRDAGRVSDALWRRLAARFTPAQCLELLVLAGWYHVIAFVANGARVALEPWAARFPPA
jgi:4-carboxymuconolactone decarboxylase